MAIEKLLECYLDLKSILGDNIEPFESVQLIEEYRKYWRPEKVKTILLAESHVFTTKSDRAIKLENLINLPGYPNDYAKFVYCLAYGERMVTNDRAHPSRDGTPQFWKNFYSCMNPVDSNNDFWPILSKTPYPKRIENKINLLKQMKKSGVWLVDASIVALYNQGKKPSSNTLSKTIQVSWRGYTKQVVNEASPKHVIIIGNGVARNIENELRSIVGDNYTIIAQPNAHLSASEHLSNFKKYYALCC